MGTRVERQHVLFGLLEQRADLLAACLESLLQGSRGRGTAERRLGQVGAADLAALVAGPAAT
jgi:hypothetical protein